MKKKKILFFLISGFCLFLHTQAQVTIGSNIVPNKGALLDIKSQDGDVNNVTATKGLGVPRVALRKIKQLYPMFSTTPTSDISTAEYTTGKTTIDLAHTGLVVYNITIDPAADNLLDVGLYTWDGTQWVTLKSVTKTGGELGAGVIEHPAVPGLHDGFISADFGAAGRWMTTNYGGYDYDTLVKAGSNYVPFNQGVNADYLGFYGSPGFAVSATDLLPKWNYPSNTGPASITLHDNFLFITATSNPYKYTGRLYSYIAAISTVTPRPAGELGGVTTQAFRQGICPNGWHLPSDYEWTELQNEMALHTTTYSAATANGSITSLPFLSPTGLPAASASVGGSTYPYPLPTNGISKNPDQGGFAILLTGYSYSPNGNGTNFASIYAGNQAWFWTSSTTLSSTSQAWCRVFGSGLLSNATAAGTTVGATNAVTKSISTKMYHMAVRCKKD